MRMQPRTWAPVMVGAEARVLSAGHSLWGTARAGPAARRHPCRSARRRTAGAAARTPAPGLGQPQPGSGGPERVRGVSPPPSPCVVQLRSAAPWLDLHGRPGLASRRQTPPQPHGPRIATVLAAIPSTPRACCSTSQHPLSRERRRALARAPPQGCTWHPESHVRCRRTRLHSAMLEPRGCSCRGAGASVHPKGMTSRGHRNAQDSRAACERGRRACSPAAGCRAAAFRNARSTQARGSAARRALACRRGPCSPSPCGTADEQHSLDPGSDGPMCPPCFLSRPADSVRTLGVAGASLWQLLLLLQRAAGGSQRHRLTPGVQSTSGDTEEAGVQGQGMSSTTERGLVYQPRFAVLAQALLFIIGAAVPAALRLTADRHGIQE